jgi:hypothetical protein
MHCTVRQIDVVPLRDVIAFFELLEPVFDEVRYFARRGVNGVLRWLARCGCPVVVHDLVEDRVVVDVEPIHEVVAVELSTPDVSRVEGD